MQGTKIEIGRIDLTTNCSFFEVPSEDAALVMSKMKRAKVGDRKVVVDNADRTETAAADKKRAKGKPGNRRAYADVADAQQVRKQFKAEKRAKRKKQNEAAKPDYVPSKKAHKKDDWRQFFE